MDRPPSIWSIDDAIAERDFTYLCKLVGEDLPGDVREHLAKAILALLTKQIKYPPHRLRKQKTFFDMIAMGARVWELKCQQAKKPIQSVAVEFDCSIRTVEGAWSFYKKWSKELGDEKRRDDALMDAAHEARWDAAVQSLKDEHGDDREFSDEEVEAAAKELDEAWASERYDD